MTELKKLIEANPLIRDKLKFPTFSDSRLRMLINQSLNRQHSLCQNPKQNLDIKTLFVDHSCRNSSDSINANNQPRVDANQPTSGLNGLVNPAAAFMSKAAPMDSAENGLRMRFPRASERTLLVANPPSQIMTAPVANWADEFPKSVSRILAQGSNVTTMDFHPIHQTLLLVGTSIGEISLWEVSSREKLATRSFQNGASAPAGAVEIVEDDVEDPPSTTDTATATADDVAASEEPQPMTMG